MIKRILQFILALILATIILVIVILISPYLAMQAAWELVTGGGESENEIQKRKGDD